MNSLTMPIKLTALISALLGPIVSAAPVQSADHVDRLQAYFSTASPTDTVRIDKELARNLYLEHVRLRTKGIDFLNGCTEANLDNHRQLPVTTLPALRHKGFTIVGSPYHSVPIKTGKNNNEVYFKRLTGAIDLIEANVPDSFAEISKIMADKRGYIIVENICPTNGNLAFAAFLPRPQEDHFVVMVSSTLLLLPDLFNDYDIAAQLVHEMEGHAVDFYRRGVTDETHAFIVQSKFAERIGDDKFSDVNNRHQNLKTKVHLKLSKSGTYVESKSPN